MAYIVSIDQSTSASKVFLVDRKGAIVRRFSKKHAQYYPNTGWSEHDAGEIFDNVVEGIRVVTEGIPASEIACISISNQRETTAFFERETGKPARKAIVWQDVRAKQLCDGLRPCASKVKELTGLDLSPYYSAAKAAHALKGDDTLRKRAKNGGICISTIDGYLVYRLTGGKCFATDVSNASRTQLFNLKTLSFDEELCKVFSIPSVCLPEVKLSDECFGETSCDGLPAGKDAVHHEADVILAVDFLVPEEPLEILVERGLFGHGGDDDAGFFVVPADGRDEFAGAVLPVGEESAAEGLPVLLDDEVVGEAGGPGMHGAVQLPERDVLFGRDLGLFAEDAVFDLEGVLDVELVDLRALLHADGLARDRLRSGDDLLAVGEKLDGKHFLALAGLRVAGADEVATALGTAGHAVVGAPGVDADQLALPLDAVDVPAFPGVQPDPDVAARHGDGFRKFDRGKKTRGQEKKGGGDRRSVHDHAPVFVRVRFFRTVFNIAREAVF